MTENKSNLYWFTHIPPTKGTFVAIWRYNGIIHGNTFMFDEDGSILSYEPDSQEGSPWQAIGVDSPAEVVVPGSRHTLMFAYIAQLDS